MAGLGVDGRVLLVNRTELGEDPARPALAIVLVGLALATTVAVTVVLVVAPRRPAPLGPGTDRRGWRAGRGRRAPRAGRRSALLGAPPGRCHP
ncbi:MAG TPA: hypothetical protein VK306_01190 [Acidimicrobiales bacterium]|nr:hypothetical protein [Acidimicrobiales bacterium]